MSEAYLTFIACVLILGILAQWAAWKFNFPSILLLLIFGFLSGPSFLNLVSPDKFLGELLFPIVSLSVAIILFEGGLNLKFKDISGIHNVIVKLISIGCLVTWILASLGAWIILKLSPEISILLGAILTVSGPTVVLPLVRHVRPKAPLGEVLKWEGILIDPVGAVLAVLVYEALIHGSLTAAPVNFIIGLGQTTLSGGIIGIGIGSLLKFLMNRRMIPAFLESSFTLMLVIFSYILANHFHPESGLLAVTLMGIYLANSSSINVKHILEFNENLTVLLLSTLFIILAARVEFSTLKEIQIIPTLLFLFFLILVVRPLAVFTSTIGNSLNIREKLFLAWLAPRGIVAAAVSALFGLELTNPGSELLAPYTFLIIVGTVLIYGLTAKHVAKFLDVRQKRNEGVLILGGSLFSRLLALEIKKANFPVCIIDTNFNNIATCRIEGIEAVHGNILKDKTIDSVNLDGIGKLLALTANHEANSLTCLKLTELFGRDNVFQLPEKQAGRKKSVEENAKHIRGRILFTPSSTYYNLDEKLYQGWSFKTTNITNEFSYEKFGEHYNGDFIPIAITSPSSLEIITTKTVPKLEAKHNLISLIKEKSS